MAIASPEPYRAESTYGETQAEIRHERWAHCHVNWTAIFVGALTTFGLVVLFGLVGIALGANVLTPEHRVVDVHKMGLWTLIFSVAAAFLAAAAGGWVAGKIAGILHSEPAMLHGAIVWLVTVPMLVVGTAMGASSLFGAWYGGLGMGSASAAPAPFVRPEPLGPTASAEDAATYRATQAAYEDKVRQWREETPQVTRNSALVAATALLMALLGSVIGGWMAAGEPMNFSHYRTRKPIYHMP